MYELYQRVAPRPEDFPRLLDKAGQAMRQDFDFTEELRGLQVPTLIVAADADMAPPRSSTAASTIVSSLGHIAPKTAHDHGPARGRPGRVAGRERRGGQ